MKSSDLRVLEKSPIFVVGCSRSGTTLLRLMLTCHPDVCIPPESSFIAKLYPNWGHRSVQTRNQIQQLCDELYSCDKKFRDWGLGRKQILGSLENIRPFSFREFVDTIYSQYMEQTNKNGARWGDKNPQYVNRIRLVMDLFPKAKFLHIIRDGRAVFNSFIKANCIQGRIYPNTPYEAAQYWCDALKAVYPFRKHPNYFELRYEDLVTNPEKVLWGLCHFLEITYLPREMLSYPYVNVSRQLVPKHRLAWHEATLRAVDADKTSEWRSELTWHQAILFELCAGWELVNHGYDLVLSFTQWRLLNKTAMRILKTLRSGCK